MYNSEYINVMGLTNQEFVALMGGHSLGQMHTDRSGYTGAWTTSPTKLDNSYFVNLVNYDWVKYDAAASASATGGGDDDESLDTATTQYRACPDVNDESSCVYAMRTDLLLKYDQDFFSIAVKYASDEALFKSDFVKAWEKLISLDTFVTPELDACTVIDFSSPSKC
jgi:catalase (peroxidase I)